MKKVLLTAKERLSLKRSAQRFGELGADGTNWVRSSMPIGKKEKGLWKEIALIWVEATGKDDVVIEGMD
jgi:hypothetical protein